ncbi:MAG TPA: hypothetical protein VFS30_05455 [Dehalococcoidia bacterium]|nr:hypothetical protein [Dehalococcoidia bacterium]
MWNNTERPLFHPNRLDGARRGATSGRQGRDLHGQLALGKAIALRPAQDGCDIGVCGRSLESTDDLPGSIGETADAIRAPGRRALVSREIVDQIGL